MACDQHDLADAAKNLTDEYAALNFSKSRQVIREARVTAPKPGPQAPSPTHLLSLQVELEARLLEMACEVRDHVRPGYLLGTDGRSLCTFIRQQAGPASRMDVAGDLLAEMQDQANEIASVLGNLPGKEPTEDDVRAARLKKHLLEKHGDLLPRLDK